MGRLFRSKAAKATAKWLRDHYAGYPDGVSKVYKARRSGDIHVRLDDPLDVEFLEHIVAGHGYTPELTEDDGTKVLNVYDVIESNETVVTKSLNSVFRQERDVTIGADPLQGDSVHPRLVFVCDYLRGKYS